MSSLTARLPQRGDDAYGFEVEGRGRVGFDPDSDPWLFGSLEVVGPVRLSALKRVLLGSMRRFGEWQGRLALTKDPPEQVHEYSKRLDLALTALDGELFLDVELPNTYEHEPTYEEVVTPLRAFMQQKRLEPAAWIESVHSLPENSWQATVRLRWQCRAKTVSDAVAVSGELVAFARLLVGREFDCATAASIIEGGHADLLIGYHENQWLEAKSAPYRIDDAASALEFAKDIASFANAQGGLIVIGAKTKRRAEGDEIVESMGAGRRKCRRAGG